jgi:hypothetical protein
VSEPKKRVFTQEEVNAILSRAVERQSPDGGSLTRAEILDAGAQAGIGSAAIEEAIREIEEGRPAASEAERVERVLVSRRWAAWRAFSIHFSVYAMTGVFLGFINSQTGGPPWFLFPMLGWGIGLTAHFISVLFSFVFPDPRRQERIRNQLRKSDERESESRRRRDARSAQGPLVESAKELGVAMQRGMATVIADVAKTIHEEVDRAERGKRDPSVRVGTQARVRDEDDADEDEDERQDAKRSRRR